MVSIRLEINRKTQHRDGSRTTWLYSQSVTEPGQSVRGEETYINMRTDTTAKDGFNNLFTVEHVIVTNADQPEPNATEKPQLVVTVNERRTRDVTAPSVGELV